DERGLPRSILDARRGDVNAGPRSAVSWRVARVPSLLVASLALVACQRAPLAPVPSATRAVTATDITFDGEPPPEDFAETVREHTDALLAPIARCYEDR